MHADSILYRLCRPDYNDSIQLTKFKKYVSLLTKLAEQTRSEWSSISMALDTAEDGKDMDRVYSLAVREEQAGNQLLVDNCKRDYFVNLLAGEVYKY